MKIKIKICQWIFKAQKVSCEGLTRSDAEGLIADNFGGLDVSVCEGLSFCGIEGTF